jgi:hypothetical protein
MTSNDPQVKIKELQITEHAALRAMERFEHVKNSKEALNYCKQIMNNAKYIGLTTAKEGDGDNHYFTKDKIAIFISTDLKTIKSIVPVDTHGHYPPLKTKIENLYKKELRKTERNEQATKRKLEHEKYRVEAEIGVLKYRAYRTRSKTVKELCKSEIVKLQKQIDILENDLKSHQMNKRELARAMATVVF